MHTKPYTYVLAIFGLFILGFLIVSHFSPDDATAADNKQLIERGKYLVTIGGCHDCHTPKKFGEHGEMEFDLDRAFMGHPADIELPPVPEGVITMDGWVALSNAHLSAWAGPWGISFAQNLTPDKETGLGTWTAEIFIKAMRTGQHMGEGRPILPPMPWFNLAEAKDEDLKAIFAYLQSVKPIRNPVPEPVPPKH